MGSFALFEKVLDVILRFMRFLTGSTTVSLTVLKSLAEILSSPVAFLGLKVKRKEVAALGATFLRVGTLHFEWASSSGVQTESNKNCFLLKKWCQNMC